MERFDPSTSILAGMTNDQLTAALSAAQAAYVALVSGSKPVTVSYTQGDGSKSVTYSKAEIGSLNVLIRQLQAQLGIICRPRRAIGLRF